MLERPPGRKGADAGITKALKSQGFPSHLVEREENTAAVANSWLGSGVRGEPCAGVPGRVPGVMLSEGLWDPQPTDPRSAVTSRLPPSLRAGAARCARRWFFQFLPSG